MRIVSLISSATETVAALGAADQLVGISHECDYPESIRRLPVVSEPKLNPTLPGREIHAQVTSMVQAGLSIYRIKTDVLEQLKPDLILTQDQCEVCAVSLKDVEQAVCELTRKDTRICSLQPHTLDDIWRDFFRVGEAIGRDAAPLKTEFWIRLNAVNSRRDPKRTPRVLLLEWLQPPIIAGGWMPELATLAGTEPLIVTGPDRFKKVTWEEIRAADADVVALLPCGYGVDKTRSELLDPETSAALRSLRAVREGRCFVLDGNAYFNRSGPRIADSCEILAAVAHPGRFPQFEKKYQAAIRKWPEL